MIEIHAVRLIHDKMIEIYGGLPGTSDADRISGVLGRVEHLLHYEGDNFDTFGIAALYLMAISRAHIFNDANKRTALAVALYYLRRKGISLRIDIDAQAAYQDMTVITATGELKASEISDFLRSMAS